MTGRRSAPTIVVDVDVLCVEGSTHSDAGRFAEAFESTLGRLLSEQLGAASIDHFAQQRGRPARRVELGDVVIEPLRGSTPAERGDHLGRQLVDRLILDGFGAEQVVDHPTGGAAS